MIAPSKCQGVTAMTYMSPIVVKMRGKAGAGFAGGGAGPADSGTGSIDGNVGLAEIQAKRGKCRYQLR